MEDLTPSRKSLDPIETASRDEIEALQFHRMKRSLKHAYENSPFYRNRFIAADVHPEDLKSLTDIAKFPFTTKQDLRDTYPFGMFAVPRAKLVRVHGSSGTTGKPTVVGYTQGDIDVWANLVARSIRAAGGRPGDMVHVAYGYGLFTGGLGAHYGAERLGCTVVPISGGQTERQVTLITDFQPQIIMVTPSYMLSILDEFRRQGLDPRASSLKAGIFGAEPWTNAMRQEIEQAFDMHAVDIYGLSEIMGPGVAQECVETKDGLHIWEDHFYPEIIDPVTGEPLPDGQMGDRKDHRAQRRHDHPARRQRVPDPDRGTDPEMPRPCAAFPDRVDPRRAAGQHDGACGMHTGSGRRRCPGGIGPGPGASHQGGGRHFDPYPGGRPQCRCPVRRQGKARGGQPAERLTVRSVTLRRRCARTGWHRPFWRSIRRDGDHGSDAGSGFRGKAARDP